MKEDNVVATFDSTHKVSRIEIISDRGREYVNMNTGKVTISFQDDDRTMKIFIKERIKS